MIRITPAMQRWAMVAAKTVIIGVFIPSVTGKLTGWHQTAGFMAAKGMPFVPFFLVMAVILELGGTLLVITGLQPRIGAAMLILFLVPTTVIFHNFWAVHGPDRQMQMGNFVKNLSIIGGLGMVVLTDWRAKRGDM